MKFTNLLFCLVCCASLGCANAGWQEVDEGFLFSLPSDWKKEEERGIDSHVGKYVGKSAYLEFDEVYGLGYTVEKSKAAIDKMKLEEAQPKLLKSGEEIWHVDGRTARFKSGKVDAKEYGNREYQNVASLFVPYEGKEAYLAVYVIYSSDSDLQTVRTILKSFKWRKEEPPSVRK